MNKLNKVLLTIAFCAAALNLSGCGVDSQEQIDSKYSVEAVNITKISDLDGVSFYVPDSYLDRGTTSSTAYSYTLSGNNFDVRVISNTIDDSEIDMQVLSDKFSSLFGLSITINKSVKDGKWECMIQKDDKTTLNGYIKQAEDHLILAVGENEDTSKTIVDSLKKNKTKHKNAESIESVKLNDANLNVTVNGVGIGEKVSIDQIKSDFASLAQNHEKMKQELSNINGNTIEEINNNVYLQFRTVSENGKEAHEAYLQSICAYNNAINQYNVMINNTIDLNSTKKAIEKAMKIDLSPEWNKLVIENENTESNIRSIIIEYDNERDQISSMIINGDESLKEKINKDTEDYKTDNNDLTIDPSDVPDELKKQNGNNNTEEQAVIPDNNAVTNNNETIKTENPSLNDANTGNDKFKDTEFGLAGTQ